MFNIGYGCRIVVSFNFRSSLHILILLECGLFSRTVGTLIVTFYLVVLNQLLSGFQFPGILFICACRDRNMVSYGLA